VPLRLTTDATAVALTGEDEIVGAVGTAYRTTAGLPSTTNSRRSTSETTMLNASTAPAPGSTLRGCGLRTARSDEWDLAYVITHGVASAG